jgi:hypothetical protein
VARRPYEALVSGRGRGPGVGAVYLSKQREIGVSILPARRGAALPLAEAGIVRKLF